MPSISAAQMFTMLRESSARIASGESTVEDETAKMLPQVKAAFEPEQPPEPQTSLDDVLGAIQQLAKVLTAPRKLVMDADGKPIGVKIEAGGDVVPFEKPNEAA